MNLTKCFSRWPKLRCGALLFISMLGCVQNSHANPPDGNVLIGPGDPFAFWAVERALFPGESVRFTVAVADGGFANGGKPFVLDGEPTVQSIGPNTLWMPKDVDDYSIGFEALNNGDEPLQETIEVHATWKEQLSPPSGGGKGAPPEPETIDGVGSGFAYTDRPVFTWDYPGTRLQFADGETTINFSVTAAANGAALDMNAYDIAGETAWIINDNPAGVNRIDGTVKSDSVGEGNLKITYDGKTQGTSPKKIAFADFDLAIAAFGTEPDLNEDRKPGGGNEEPPHEMDPGGMVLATMTGNTATFPRTKLTLTGDSNNPGENPSYKLSKENTLSKAKLYTLAANGELVPLEKTWNAQDFAGGQTLYVEADPFAPEDAPQEGKLTLTYNCTLDGEAQELKDDLKASLLPVAIDAIAFNYDDTAATEDALNIRENSTTSISIPEYVNTVQNKPAAYIKDSAVSILVRVKAGEGTSAIESLKIKGVSDDANGSLGDAEEKSVTFTNGVSDEGVDNTVTAGIDESEYAKFQITGNTPNKVLKSEEAWKWIVTEVNGVGITNTQVARTSEHRVYVVLDTPKSPWNQTVGNTQNPWANALEFAIITCNTDGESTEDGVMEAITTQLYTIPYTGASQCLAPDGNFSYTAFMTTTTANCLDSAVGLDASGSLLGMDVIGRRRTKFFDFNFHCFVSRGSHVYDSCSAMSSAVIKMDYVAYKAAGSPGTTSVETEETYPLK